MKMAEGASLKVNAAVLDVAKRVQGRLLDIFA
jgi:hypothetical protein